MHSLKIDIWRQTEDIVFIIVCLHEQIRNKFFSFSVTRQAKRILHKGKSHSTADLQLVCFGFSSISTQRERVIANFLVWLNQIQSNRWSAIQLKVLLPATYVVRKYSLPGLFKHFIIVIIPCKLIYKFWVCTMDD